MKPIVRDIIITIASAVVIFFALQATVQNYVIWESSMEPNFYDGQRILVNKVVYNFHDPERGDVIILQPPPPYSPDSTPFIKRIVGLPGETIEIRDGGVYINGVKLDEPYIKEPPSYVDQHKILPNHYYVLGDNRNHSNDSHTGWTVPRENILGKTWITIWPLDKLGLVATYSFQLLTE